MNAITSAANPRVQDLVRLRKSRDFREETGLFVVEGAVLCGEAAAAGLPVHSVFYTERAARDYGGALGRVLGLAPSFAVTEPVAEKASGQKTPQGIFVVLRRPPAPGGAGGNRVLLLERIQDPVNLGAIARSALAFGFRGLRVSRDSADCYSGRAQRAAMGALLRLCPVGFDSAAAEIAALRAGGFSVFAAVPKAGAVPVSKLCFPEKTAIVIGNEAEGLRGETVAAADAAVTVPTGEGTESLNAAAAASILMWEVARRNGG